MPPENQLAIPTDVNASLGRGRKQMRRDAPKRRLCMRFEKGDTYWYINGRGALDFQSTVMNATGAGKPPHRIRNTYNFIRPIVEAKVSAATQRIPSYEITPTSSDETAMSAANLSERVARYGYDKWRLRNVSMKTVKLAISGGGDGFALPYFDPNVGPYRQVDGKYVGEGELKVLVLTGNEVYWEAGTDFMESRWYAIERARTLEDVKAIPGYSVGKDGLPADASTSDIPNDRDATDNLVMVTEYFERPTSKYPNGRCITMAGGKPIVDYRLLNPAAQYWWGDYPLLDHDGTVLDEPILHRLSYTVDADTDQDFGLVWQLIDFQRTAQDCVNKLLEWKNRCLNPQMVAIVGSIVTPPNDVPGDIRYVRNIGGVLPQWETPPAIPHELFQLLDWSVNAMSQVASDQNVDPAPNLAAKTLQAGIEQSQNRWQSFLGDLAEWHSRLMRHCLLLVARHYTEPRLLELRGRDGWELVSDFQGAHLMGQTMVRVLPASLTPITRSGIQDQLTWLAQIFPGWLNPEAALAALTSGDMSQLSESYWLDVGRANTIIQKIRDGSVMSMPDRIVTTPGGGQQSVPSFMPRDGDDLKVWKSMFSNYLKTDDFNRLDPGLQEVVHLVWAGIEQLETEQAQRAADLQNQMAAQNGLQNAAKMPVKQMPSLPGGTAQAPAA
jgi:hypothetical protein